MSKSNVVLLDHWVSPYAMRVRIALWEKGVEFESRQQDLGNKSELLLRSNPIYKKAPVLLHDNKPLCESLIIVGYIDEVWPSPPLLPSSSYERAIARFWADFIDKKFAEAATKIWRSARSTEELEAAKNEFFEALKQLEEFLGEKDYFGGENFGLVDLALIPFWSWFSAYEKFGGFKIDSPKLSAWMQRCMERENVAKALPTQEKVLEFVCMLRKILGFDQ
ncbi:hypothetical protein IEQ34_005399 [Dendrobium chrysotoxum]|uniref:Probable glutathione S-transferase GSTU1 n=1 Tax=Dendrobium chrysotoxum TaxID=161865 RepID=A0AAV7H8S3_DENCH|nr:hypothetical protein IEQ34_005399 [Dendrobium chrysotoxum]